MSYETMRDELQKAPCACGKGFVVRRYYFAMNDWNQTREGYTDQEIKCDICKAKYHIEETTKHYFCPPWKGDGNVTNFYLVPNGDTLHPDRKYARTFSYAFDDTCVADYPVQVLQDVIKDMKNNKYSTRLKLEASQKIVDKYYRHYKKRSLPPIISALQNCVDNYDSYEWTYDKMQEYLKLQKEEAEKNDKYVADVLKKSFPLDFE